MHSTQSAEASFARGMRDARERRGWTQRGLAARLHEVGLTLDPSAVTRIEQARRAIRLDEASTIAHTLGVPLAELIGEQDPSTAALELASRANRAAGGLATAILEYVEEAAELVYLLMQRPELCAKLPGLQSPADYYRWASEHVAQGAVLRALGGESPLGVETEQERDGIRALIAALADGLTQPMPGMHGLVEQTDVDDA